jgi:hypothetical protein
LPGAYAHAPPGDTQQQSNDGEPEEISSWGKPHGLVSRCKIEA